MNLKKSSIFNRIFSRENKKNIESLKVLKKKIKLAPTDIISRRILGDLYLKTKNKPKALEQFQWLAEYYKKEGFYTKAIAIYDRIVKIDPLNDQHSFDLADIYIKKKMKTEAKSIYRNFIIKAKKKKDSSEVIKLLNKIISIDNNNLNLRIEKAVELLKNREKLHAVQEYLFIVDRLIKTKNFDEGIKILTEIGIKDKKLSSKLLICYIEKDMLNKGLDLIKKEKLENSNNMEINGSIIALYLKKNSIKKALKVNKKVFKKDPKATVIFIKIAIFYLKLERYDEAYNYLLPFINENISLKNYNGARNMLNTFISYKYDFIIALKKLGSVYKKINDTSLLISHYESLIPIYKKRGKTDDLIELLKELIKISKTPFTYKQLLKDISAATELHIANYEFNKENKFLTYNNRFVEDYLNAGDFENAFKTLSEIIEKNPDLIEPKISMIEVLEKSGYLSKALEMAKETIAFMVLKGEITDSLGERKIGSDTTDSSIFLKDIFLNFKNADYEEEIEMEFPDYEEIIDENWRDEKTKAVFSKKLFQRQRTFKKNTSNKSDMRKFLGQICNSIEGVLTENNKSCKSVCLKLMDTDSKSISKKKTIRKNIYKGIDILKHSKILLKEIETGNNKIKSIAVSVSKFGEIEEE